MPKKKGSPTKIIVVVLLIAVVAVAFIAWHDGKILVTPMGDINDLTVDSGPVRVRGTITIILGDLITINDGTGGVAFTWADADSFSVTDIVVVTAEVFSAHILQDVTSVQRIWLFA
jgi:hypothetical protein